MIRKERLRVLGLILKLYIFYQMLLRPFELLKYLSSFEIDSCTFSSTHSLSVNFLNDGLKYDIVKIIQIVNTGKYRIKAVLLPVCELWLRNKI